MTIQTAQARHSAVTEDYLQAIWSASEHAQRESSEPSDSTAPDAGLTVNELAARMGVVASTASENVQRLKAQGLVTHEPYRKVHLTAQGRAVALGMIRRHRLLETYLHDKLDFTWDEVHEEAEILEHAVSDRLLRHLDKALGHPARDPHGDPIPGEDGSIRTPEMILLTRLDEGSRAVVARISDDDPQALRELEEAGIRLDVWVSIAGEGDGGARRVLVSPTDATALGESDGDGTVVELDAARAALVSVALIGEE